LKVFLALFQYFSRNDLEQVHATVLRLMNEVGVRFPHEPALQVLKKAGCRVDADRVRFPGNIVEDAVRKAPSKFTIYGRNPEQKVEIGGDNIVFLPCYDVIVEGAEKCDFLGHPHTIENFRTELHVPTLSFRSSYFEWVEKGRPDILETAHQKWNQRLSDFQAPDLPPELEKDLRKYVDNIACK
jgi:trimethylamine:corrinoid methyltransferase-like protein